MTAPKIEIQRSDEVGASPRAASLRRWARAALDGIGESGSLCIRLVGEAEMTDLNGRYRNKRGATNVLSFGVDMVAPDGGQRLLGDVVICAPLVATQASLQGKSETDHFAHLVVHGVLHLCGFDHETAQDAQVMEGHEVAILKTLGINDPYR